jgi:hypothetical protein
LSASAKLPFPYAILSNWDAQLSCNEFKQVDAFYSTLTIGEYLKVYATNDTKILKEGILNFFLNLKEIGVVFNKNFYTCGGIALKYYLSR